MKQLHKCCTCGYEWIHGFSGDHSCGAFLKIRFGRVVWLLERIHENLPVKRDWLNPDYEQEMKSVIEENKYEN